MKKNKLIALSAAVVLSATAVVGGTLAYFTDTDEATNVFEVGGVEIDLHEKNAEGAQDDAYQAWLSDQILVPGKTIDKIVTIENTGASDAYVWAEIWVPAVLDDENARSLHRVDADGVTTAFLGEKKDKAGNVTHVGYKYYIDDVVEPEASTAALLNAVRMDAKVSQGEGENIYVLANGETTYDGTWEVRVNAVGIQAEGFANIEEAMNAYYEVPAAE